MLEFVLNHRKYSKIAQSRILDHYKAKKNSK